MILALDTSAGISVALLDGGGRVLAQAASAAERMHAEQLAPLIGQVFSDAGRRPRDLTAIAVGTGPAPYTGLRVGLVTAAALSEALHIPTWGVSSLDAIAAGLPAQAGEVLVVTDAKRREVYWARYGSGSTTPTAGPSVAQPVQLDVGGAAVFGTPIFPGATPAKVEAALLGQLAIKRAASGAVQSVKPLYLRRPDATPNPAKPLVSVPTNAARLNSGHSDGTVVAGAAAGPAQTPTAKLAGLPTGEPRDKTGIPITIRPVRSEEAKQFSSWDVDLFGPLAWTQNMYREELVGPGRWYVAAEIDGEVAGWAGLWFDGDDAQIMTISTRNQFQRRGVGQALLDALIARGRELGAARMLLEVAVDSEPALALYAKNGFAHLGLRKRYYGGRDAYTLAKGLQA